ncbi:hypothetical protein PHSY_006458 [Pseudozyma hubeiensis SY62]|uniref:CCHC-type domain-containing protein n=1 Tax=Pseudozyma hubeiensis (strain SY62) TaxID=1305764 RepID=R9PBU0_PSEHS|nr:hypothetical protein PHSY_006458 [Pseudozyma hubeiensis SY62]GAC98863.1 hypothetical protein PHSY_006458 [Pseudozyma hubeiensis SY62]
MRCRFCEGNFGLAERLSSHRNFAGGEQHFNVPFNNHQRPSYTMTRYTKLDGRRSLAKKTVDSDSEPELESTAPVTPAKVEVQPPVSEAALDTPSKEKKKKDQKEKKDKKDRKSKEDKTEDDDATAAADDAEPRDDVESAEPVASTSASASTEVDADTTTVAADPTTPAADAEPPTIEKLLKRAKLLKLKAKKAKNEESKKRFQRMTRDIERQVEQMFGSFEYGPKGQLIRLGAAQSDTMWQSRQKGGDWSAPASSHSLGGDGGWGARGGQHSSSSNNNFNSDRSWGNNKTDDERRMDRRDARREERAEQRQSKLKCFACRGMGHSAKDCPNALDAQSISLKSDTGGTTTDSPMIGRDAVGICFRCGSTEHTLSKCRKPALKNDELPYATCFICHSKGHLSSKCPNNAGRGVYPEGGSCKLCSSVEHLAKDCPLALRNEGKSHKMDREAKSLVNQVIVGSTKDSSQAGGDEDDFHSFARKRAQVDGEAKADKREGKRLKKDAKVVSF